MIKPTFKPKGFRNKTQSKESLVKFIREPEQLKMLLLSGNIIPIKDFSIINKCKSLIKLDISHSMIRQFPHQLNFIGFDFLRILLIHQNLIENLQTLAPIFNLRNLYYLTVIGNIFCQIPGFQLYFSQHPQLIVLDNLKISPILKKGIIPKCKMECKFPLVQVNQKNLQSEKDYLNILKLEIYKLAKIRKQFKGIQKMNKYLKGFRKKNKIVQIQANKQQNKWYKRMKKNYQLRCQLKQIMLARDKPELLLKRWEYINFKRIKAITQVKKYTQYIRSLIRGKKALRLIINNYFQSKSTFKIQTRLLQEQNRQRLFFFKEQRPAIQKILIYAKKILFNKGQFNLCNKFNEFVILKKSLYFVRGKKHVQFTSDILGYIKRAMRLEIGYLSRGKNILYTTHGHRDIRVKSLKQNQKILTYLTADQRKKLNKLLKKEYPYKGQFLEMLECTNLDIYSIIFFVIRNYNAGFSHIILSNYAAFFQTQYKEKNIDQEFKPFLNKKIQFYYENLLKRMESAVIIQKCWRAKKDSVNVIEKINYFRAVVLIQRWYRSLKFTSRQLLFKVISRIHNFVKIKYYYLPLSLYMSLPSPSNILQIATLPSYLNFSFRFQYQSLYKILHFKSEVKLQTIRKMSFIRFQFDTVNRARQVYILLMVLTFRYGMRYIKLQEYQNVGTQNGWMLKTVKDCAIKAQGMIENKQAFFLCTSDELRGAISVKKQDENLKISESRVSMYYYHKNKRPIKFTTTLNYFFSQSVYVQRLIQPIIKQIISPDKSLKQYSTTIPVKKKCNKTRHLQNNKKQYRQWQNQRQSQISYLETIFTKRSRLQLEVQNHSKRQIKSTIPLLPNKKQKRAISYIK